jgi:hypothetical protein
MWDAEIRSLVPESAFRHTDHAAAVHVQGAAADWDLIILY